jgi:hypothetical protein
MWDRIAENVKRMTLRARELFDPSSRVTHDGDEYVLTLGTSTTPAEPTPAVPLGRDAEHARRALEYAGKRGAKALGDLRQAVVAIRCTTDDPPVARVPVRALEQFWSPPGEATALRANLWTEIIHPDARAAVETCTGPEGWVYVTAAPPDAQLFAKLCDLAVPAP